MKEGRYQYLEKIGEGGMATVYRGLQRSLNRPVAIKVLSATLSNAPEVIKRFKRESLIIARLNHPNIIHVIDKGTTSQGRPVFVMEFVEGQTLGEAIRAGRLSFNQKIDVVIQLCKGIAYAHKLGVIHRDIKPANVIIDHEGNAKLLDFGIASFFETSQKDQAEDARLVLGTEAYMAPEQQQGLAATSTASDIYSLGLLMFELFSGERPSSNIAETLFAVPDMPPAMATLILQCIESEPKERPESVEKIKTKVLLLMKGQHITDDQASRASQGLSEVASQFGLLDVLREDKHSAVYLFEDKRSHRLIVIKKRHASMAGYKEAKLLSKLENLNIAQILGVSKNHNLFIVVSEYVAGGCLKDRLIEPLPVEAFLEIAIQIARGLAFAHKNRVIHGNLRPSNVLLGADNTVKLADFGLDEHYRFAAEAHNWYGDGRDQGDELSDIFSLGAIYYHMLTSLPPDFKRDSLIKSQHFVDLSEELQQLIERMLSRDVDQRPQSAESIVSELLPMLDEVRALNQPLDDATVLKSVPVEAVVYRQNTAWTRTLGLALLCSLALNLWQLQLNGFDALMFIENITQLWPFWLTE